MKIIHIMADGTRRDSIEGIVIRNKDFYQVLSGILAKKEAGNARSRSDDRQAIFQACCS